MTTRRLPSHLTLLLGTLLAPGCYTPHDVVVDSNDDSGGSEADSSSGSATSSPTTTAPTSTDATTTDSTTNPSTTATTDDTETGETTSADSTDGEPVCGDGMVEGDEVCDDGVNDGSYGGCEADCTALGPHCGDGVEQGDEVCDDGDEVNGDGCNIDCVFSGSAIWTQNFGDGPAYALGLDDDDGVLVAYAGTEYQYIDVDGALGWEASYSLPGGTTTLAQSVDYHEDQAWMAAGQANTDAQGYNIWWRPYSDAGSPGNSTTYDNPTHSSDFMGQLKFNADGQFYVFAYSNRSDLGQGYDVWLRKFDVDGDEMWTRDFDGGAGDNASAIAVGSDGYLVVAGSTEVDGEGRNAWLRKYSPEGSVEWTRTSAGAGTSADWIEGVAIAADLSIAVIGNQSDDIWVRKYNEDGDVEWTDVYDGPGDVDSVCNQFCFFYDSGQAVAFDSTGALVAVGGQMTSDTGGDTWVRKYDASGVELWTDLVAPNADALFQLAFDVVVTSTDDIVVGGSWVEGETVSAWVQKYTP